MFEAIKSIVGDIASGAVKDQRIALTQEQLTALDLKLRDALDENELLRSQNATLRNRVVEMDGLLADRDLKLAQLKPVTNRLHDDAEKILKLFFDTQKDFSAQEMSSHFNLSIGATESHFDTLKERKLIVVSRPSLTINGVGPPAFFKITKDGRAFANRV